MKKAICINVDLDTWIVAKEKVANLSEYLNGCLKGLSGKSPEDRTIEELQAELDKLRAIIQETTIKQSVVEESIKAVKESKALKDKEMAENDQYMRWKCPVCKQLNYIDENKICTGHCGLPTKDSPKTVIVDIREVQP